MGQKDYELGSVLSEHDEECLRYRKLGVITVSCGECSEEIEWVRIIAFDLNRHTLLVKGVCLSCMRYLDFVEVRINEIYTKPRMGEGDVITLNGKLEMVKPVN